MRSPWIRSCTLATLGLAVLSVVPVQAATCDTVQFGALVLEKFPNVRNACLDIISRDGQDYAVFKADLVRTSNRGVYVRAKRSDGTRGKTTFIALSKDRRVLVDGKPVHIQDLALGQELTAYAKVSEPMLALAPVESEPLELSPIVEEVPQQVAPAPAMPKTAGPLPIVAVLGGVLILLGLLFGLVRKRLLSN